MFKKLLEYFKRKKTFMDFKVTNSILLKKTVNCYGELYKELGIEDYIKDKIVTDQKYHYKNIRANTYTIRLIEDNLKHNLTTKKNKWTKMFKKEKLDSMFAFDALMFSPYIDETVPNATIRIILPSNKKFVELKEDK